MPVFISHSFESKPEFENIAEALDQAGVPYWNPEDVEPGSSLRDQLRQAVAACDLCIFVATHKAVESNWCGSELGAFWGADKRIIVYLADSSLKKADLPKIVQDDVWERKISKVVQATAALLEGASAVNSLGTENPAQVGDLTVDQLQELIADAVAAATANSTGVEATPEEISRGARDAASRVVDGKEAVKETAAIDHSWRTRILWVDDRPSNNVNERRAFESMGLEFTLALSTKEALDSLSGDRFGAIISDMGRKEGPREGYVLLDALRESGNETPFFIYAGSAAPEHRREAQRRGAQGTTNAPHELVDMVTRVLFAEDAG